MVLTKEQELIIKKYCDNNLKELKRICYPIISIKPNLFQYEYDDLYDDAMKVLMESVVSYDENKGCSFETFLRGNIKRSFYDYTRDKLRWKRCNLEIDENGRIKLDEKGNPIPIADVSFEGIDLKEKIKLDYSVEEDIPYISKNVEDYINSFGEIQKKIAYLLFCGYKEFEIKRILNISDNNFNVYLTDMKSYEKRKILHRNGENSNVQIIEEVDNMVAATSTSEKTKNTAYSLEQLSKNIRRRRLRDDHILQRSSGQWTALTKSELISDILQGNSLTPVIISEEIKENIRMLWIIDGKQRCTTLDDYLNDGFSISKNVQINEIEYQTDSVDENGEVIYNNDGFPIPEIKKFNIVGKKFSQLPEELQDKFKEYQIPVMLNLNCTKKKIAYDIARFNRCRPMNVAQNGWLGFDEVFAEYVDNITKMDLFKIDCDKSNYSRTNRTNGSLRRIIVEAIILSKHFDEYDPDFKKLCKILSNCGNEKDFIEFYDMISSLYDSLDSDTAELFNVKNSAIWFALYSKFLTYNLPCNAFSNFLKEFLHTLKYKNIEGYTYDELDKEVGTKKKILVQKKLKLLTALMEEYLHIEKENNITELEVDADKSTENTSDNTAECEINDMVSSDTECVDQKSNDDRVLDFVKRNVSNDVDSDDVEFYQEMIDDCVKIDSPVYEKCKIALVALMGYACRENKDQDFEHWIETYSKENTEFSPSQDVNYTYMKHDFQNYIARNEVA